MRESVVEKHLRIQVRRAGGMTYKFKSPGRKNVPDRIVIWPRALQMGVISEGRIKVTHVSRVDFVECKAPGKKANPAQAREHVRLMKLNCSVLVLDTKAKVDAYVGRNR